MIAFWTWWQLNQWRVFLVLVLSFIAYYVFERFGNRIVTAMLLQEKKLFSAHHDISAEDQSRIETISAILNRFGQVFIVIIAGAILLSQLGLDIGPIIAGAGIIGITIGFGAQSFVRDLVGGMMIVFENQFIKGDVIKVGELIGEVVDVSLRTTVLRDDHGVQHYIPNGQMVAVSNYTKGWANLHVSVPVSYRNDIMAVKELLLNAATSLAKDPTWQQYFFESPRIEGIDEFTPGNAVLLVNGKVLAHQRWRLERELRQRIVAQCAAQHIILG